MLVLRLELEVVVVVKLAKSLFWLSSWALVTLGSSSSNSAVRVRLKSSF